MKGKLLSILRRAHALLLALRDDRTPRKAKAVALLALAWLVSPLDFDFVPLLGWVDDAVVIYLGSRFVDRLSPPGLFDEFEDKSPRSLRRFAVAIGAVLLVVILAFAYLLWRLFA